MWLLMKFAHDFLKAKHFQNDKEAGHINMWPAFSD